MRLKMNVIPLQQCVIQLKYNFFLLEKKQMFPCQLADC